MNILLTDISENRRTGLQPSLVRRQPSVVRRLASVVPPSPQGLRWAGRRVPGRSPLAVAKRYGGARLAKPGPSSVFLSFSSPVRRQPSVVCRLASGFTLIELLVVMVIAVVIMAISMPSFISLGRGVGMRTAVNNVRSTVALSRQWAITHREQITFVAMNNLVYQEDNGNWVTNPAYCAKNQDGGIVQKCTPLPLDVNFGAPDPDHCVTNLIFKTDGGLGNGPTTFSIKLVDKNFSSDLTKTRTISINGLTGGIQVE